MGLEEVGAKLVAELKTIQTWFGAGSPRHQRVQSLLDTLDEAGVKAPESAAGDVTNLATPGPGVRAETAADEPVEVTSVGDVADKTPVTPPAPKVDKPPAF